MLRILLSGLKRDNIEVQRAYIHVNVA